MKGGSKGRGPPLTVELSNALAETYVKADRRCLDPLPHPRRRRNAECWS